MNHRPCRGKLAAILSGFGLSLAVVFNLGAVEPAVESPKEAAKVESSVVKVFSTARYPDLYKPWTKQSATEVTGTGVVIEGRRILSNAHVVNYASQVQVQASQAGEKIGATVEFIAHGIDLAVLKLDDETFFDTHPPLARAATLPAIKDAVMAYGFPTGGNGLSITRGIVSRIEFVPYKFPVSGLRIQIDAAINPGHSGGPAVVGDKMIGLAFSHLGGAEKIGYIIPCEEIELFLNDIRDGHYDGKQCFFEELQTLENPALRGFLKLDKSVSGMVVNKPYSDASGYPLKKWDVITKIGDMAVDNQGMITIGPDLRLRFAYQIQKISQNGTVPLTVVRDGKSMAVDLPVLTKYSTPFEQLEGGYPSFFVFGPLAFSTASDELVKGLATNLRALALLLARNNPLATRLDSEAAFEGERLVVVPAPLFPHKLSVGYANPGMAVVKAINGTAIKNLGHLVEVLRDSREEFIVVEFAGRGETLVFARKELLRTTDEILTDNGVRTQGSPDVMAIWNSKPTGQ